MLNFIQVIDYAVLLNFSVGSLSFANILAYLHIINSIND